MEHKSYGLWDKTTLKQVGVLVALGSQYTAVLTNCIIQLSANSLRDTKQLLLMSDLTTDTPVTAEQERSLWEVSFNLVENVYCKETQMLIAIYTKGSGDQLVWAYNAKQAEAIVRENYSGKYAISITGVYMVEALQ